MTKWYTSNAAIGASVSAYTLMGLYTLGANIVDLGFGFLRLSARENFIPAMAILAVGGGAVGAVAGHVWEDIRGSLGRAVKSAAVGAAIGAAAGATQLPNAVNVISETLANEPVYESRTDQLWAGAAHGAGAGLLLGTGLGLLAARRKEDDLESIMQTE